VAYGFDEDGRLILRREFSEFPDLYHEGFYGYSPDRIIGQLFHYSEHKVVNCEQLVIGEAGPAYFQRYGSRGWVSYTYSCTGGRIESFSGTSKEPDEPETRFSGKLIYKPGDIVELWARDGGQRAAAMTFRGRVTADNIFIRSLQSKI
jgi:hypothetical protein